MSCRKVGFSGSVVLVVSFAFVLVCVGAAFADVKLPAVISDNMVLQQGRKVPIWGWAEPGEEIKVSVNWNGTKWSIVTADKDGKWMLKMDSPEAGGPYEMTVSDKDNVVKIKNILVGEVWLCSGQSNMEFPVWRAERWKTGVIDFEQEIAAADYPKIRLFTVKQISQEQLQPDCEGSWKLCSPETVGDFSAVAYYFGKELHKELDVPVGLINASWSGTPAEAWTRREILEAEPELVPILERYEKLVADYPQARAEYEQKLDQWKEAVEKARREGKKPPEKPVSPIKPGNRLSPSGLYNGMIAPLIPYRICGVIWYQGESNAERAYQYRKLFPAMIKNWRSDWKQGDFPFLFVQLANFQAVKPEPSESDWAELREAQLMTLALANTGMAVTIDIGDANDIHPKNKKDVGKRLALWALAESYGKKLVYSGPIYKSMSVEGNKIILHFDHIGGGLVAGGGEPLKGFAIAGADRKFVWADAKIDGDTVVVSSEQISEPVAVRYGWADNPVCNLYNEEGLPASPFRIDDWPGITVDKK